MSGAGKTNVGITTATGSIYDDTSPIPLGDTLSYPGGIVSSPMILTPGSRTKDLDIRQEENGYTVIKSDGNKVVFNDFYEMCNWMRENFDEPDPEEEE